MNYGGISDRIKATIFDFVVVGILMFITTYFLDFFEHISSSIRMGLFVLIVFLYEPIFIAMLGGTIGHHSHNLTIRKTEDESKRLHFFQALLRYALKILLGIISFFSMRADDKSRAIHDMIAGSVVIIKK